ncbi:MAG: hypothetical protein HYS44_01240 [Candidatus Niyogibacteria bacterium]|nr:hypothetical protein [Candidatus Niyogibacteria bacterium]
MALESTGRWCTACGGMVMKNTYRVQDGPLILGPGNRSHEETEYHCGQCGVVYKFPPPETISKKPAAEAPPSHNVQS